MQSIASFLAAIVIIGQVRKTFAEAITAITDIMKPRCMKLKELLLRGRPQVQGRSLLLHVITDCMRETA
jgi:hypothetical protein